MYRTHFSPNDSGDCTYIEILFMNKSVGWVSIDVYNWYIMGELTDNDLVRLAHPLPQNVRWCKHSLILNAGNN